VILNRLSVSSKAARVAIFFGLAWLYTCIHLDRQLLGILAESVKSEFNLTDRELGALTGSAFSFVYALLGLYFGHLADRRDRIRLICLGAWIWSLACLGAAAADSYAGLLLARTGIASGEAVASAAAVSLLPELVSAQNRALATSVFFACAFLGAGLAAIGGGALIHAAQGAGGFSGWRASFVAAAVPGILGAVYLQIIAPPAAPNRSVKTDRMATLVLVAAAVAAVTAQLTWPLLTGVPAALGIGLAAAAVWANRVLVKETQAFQATLGNPKFQLLVIAMSFVLFVDFAASFWLLPYPQRRFGVSAAGVGATLGSIMIAGGILGCVGGGWIADRWRRRSQLGRIWFVTIAISLEAMAIAFICLPGGYGRFIGGFVIFCLSSGMWTGVAAAIGFDIVPAAHRGTGAAIYFFATTVFGPGLGAFAVGLLSDVTGSLGHALLLSASVMVPGVFALLWLARRSTGRATLVRG
jgi:MFS transporter, Spinster family, sphingosine-1-phosphate transporter